MIARLWRRLRDLLQRDKAEAALDDEVQFHIDMEAERLVAGGMSPADALATARRRFGAIAQVKDEVRDAHGIDQMESVGRDVRVAARSLRRAPGLLGVVWLTLALGIGATTSVFSVVYAVLLAAFPFPDPERLVVPQHSTESGRGNVTYRDLQSWQDAGVFEHAAVFQRAEFDLVVGDEPIRALVAIVSADFFPTLGITPFLGRLPAPDEFQPGKERPLVLSYGLWQRLGGNPAVIGQSVRMTGVPVTVVGVLPKDASWPPEADAWYPDRSTPDDNVLRADNFIYWSVARLKPGQTMIQTGVHLATLAKQIEADFPVQRKGVSMVVQPLRSYLTGDAVPRMLWILFGGVIFVLLVACANIANLLLARAVARRHELAVRVALGASGGRLVRQLLIEALVLVLPGGALGVGLAFIGVRVLPAFAPESLPGLERVALDPAVLALAAGVTILAALAVGLIPALQAARIAPGRALIEAGSRTTAGARTRRLGSALVIGEVALSLTLLAGAGLLFHSLFRLSRVDTGMDAANVATFALSLPESDFGESASRLRFWTSLVRELEAVPGVEAAGITTGLPLRGGGFYLGRTLIAYGAPEPPQGTEVSIIWHATAPGYFGAIGQQIVEGRDFTARDDSSGAPVIIVTESLAKALFPGRSALGQRVESWREEKIPREIVGVVRNVRYNDATDTGRALVYVPLAQWVLSTGVVVVRSRTTAEAVVAPARRVLTALHPGIAMARVQSMTDVFHKSTAQARFNAQLLGLFAITALGLAAIGLGGLLAYQVAQQRLEFGVRMALGASRSAIAGLVFGRSFRLVAIGGGIGLLGAFAASRLLRTMLYEVSPGDPVTLVAVAVLLLAVALGAGWLTARRATAIDPATTLRGS